MKRSIRLLLAGSLIAGIGMFAPAPAFANHADPDVCVGNGRATLSAGLTVPGVGPAVRATFHFELSTGRCASGTTLVADGQVNGYCGSSSGHGSAEVHGEGHTFAFISQGTELVLTGQVVGEVKAVEDPLDQPSCTSTTNPATNFIITGEATTNHTPCTVTGTPGGPYTIYTCV